jgi:hypothetical protein
MINELDGAVWLAAYERDKQPLLNLLRSDYPLSREEKEYLADFIEGKLKRRRGRPGWRATDELDDPISAAVMRAAFFVRRFKAVGRENGRSRSGIHEWAINETMELMKKRGFLLPPRERLENYLRRSSRDRKKYPR